MTLEELTKIEAAIPHRWPTTGDMEMSKLCAALREAWKATEQAELWRERGIAEWQGAVATLTAENEQLQARIAELECLLISWHYGPTMQDTSNAFRSLKEIAKDLAAKREAKQ